MPNSWSAKTTPPGAFPTVSDEVQRVVFDCNVFAHAMITPSRAAGRWVEAVVRGELSLFWTQYIIDEVRRIPEKPTPKRLGITRDVTDRLVYRLFPLTNFIREVPALYTHPIDPKDSHYVSLAAFTRSQLIASSDRHLLNLVTPGRPEAADFSARFPSIRILQPWELLGLLPTRR